MKVFYSDQFVLPLPEGHRFPMKKYSMLRKRVERDGICGPGESRIPQPVTDEEILRAHEGAYLEKVVSGKLTDKEMRRIGFPWSKRMVERSRRASGGTLGACRAALEDGLAANLAGGTHHAFGDRGEGFCVFNDIAVAIRVLQAEKRIERAVVVDLDVHQGNGTAAIFEGDDSVFTFSVHGEHNFPFRKQRSCRDVGLPDGTGDSAYLDVLAAHLPEVLEAASADLLFYQAGVDPLAEDALGRMSLTHAGMRERDRLVLEAAWHRGLPVVLTLGGGYAKPITATLGAHVGTYETALSVFR